MRAIRALALCCVLGVAFVAASCNSSEKQAPASANGSANAGQTPIVDAVEVISQTLKITVHIPSELTPYETVGVYPKVTGFVKSIKVDRGSRVKSGEVIAQLEAPELIAQRAEAQAKLRSYESLLVAAEAKQSSDQGTYDKLSAAAATPGVVAKNDVVVAEKLVQVDAAQVKAAQDNVSAAKQSLQSVTEMEGYLQIRAPFDGVVTERNVHPGALVGPAGGPGASVPMVQVQTLARLRLVIPVPEKYAAGIPEGTKVKFMVSAYPGEMFTGTVARISHAVDEKTRTMPVELDVVNPAGRLNPGAFTDVLWPVERPQPTLFVPPLAVASTLERIFVVRINNGTAEWVDVKTGATAGNLVEIFGDVHDGDIVASHGTDEIRPGSRVNARIISPEQKNPQ
jgi:membrane fusion protein (multidrug efflux system)